MRRFLTDFLLFVAVFFVVMILISLGSVFNTLKEDGVYVRESSVLLLSLDGIIIKNEEFLNHLNQYGKKDKIKGVIIRVNSPGGVVGKSQEIYKEIKRVKNELKKPVLVVCENVAASGAYYSILGASQILTLPGTLMGSIGVIMHFSNLEELYAWAKIKPYTIQTGSFKDAGGSFRAMSEYEKKYFTRLIEGVLNQFKTAIEVNRRMILRDVLDEYSDGRVFTGETAVKLGFADKIGTYVDALKIMGDLTGLGEKIKIFKPPKKRNYLLDELFSKFSLQNIHFLFSKTFQPLSLQKQIVGKPLYLLPGSI